MMNFNKACEIYKNEPTKEERIAQLKTALQDAVEKQEFELAAKLRDEIRDMEGGENA